MDDRLVLSQYVILPRDQFLEVQFDSSAYRRVRHSLELVCERLILQKRQYVYLRVCPEQAQEVVVRHGVALGQMPLVLQYDFFQFGPHGGTNVRTAAVLQEIRDYVINKILLIVLNGRLKRFPRPRVDEVLVGLLVLNSGVKLDLVPKTILLLLVHLYVVLVYVPWRIGEI